MADFSDESIIVKYRQYFINDPLLKDLYLNDTHKGGAPCCV